jgi:hypothetical protein
MSRLRMVSAIGEEAFASKPPAGKTTLSSGQNSDSTTTGRLTRQRLPRRSQIVLPDNVHIECRRVVLPDNVHLDDRRSSSPAPFRTRDRA